MLIILIPTSHSNFIKLLIILLENLTFELKKKIHFWHYGQKYKQTDWDTFRYLNSMVWVEFDPNFMILALSEFFLNQKMCFLIFFCTANHQN